MNLIKKVVKKKKLLFSGHNHVLVIPKKWIDELEWTRQTELVMEFVPYRNMIIISSQIPKDEVNPDSVAPKETHDDQKSDIITI